MYDLLNRKKGDWTDHIQKLESTLNKLMKKGIKCDIENYFFEKPK